MLHVLSWITPLLIKEVIHPQLTTFIFDSQVPLTSPKQLPNQPTLFIITPLKVDLLNSNPNTNHPFLLHFHFTKLSNTRFPRLYFFLPSTF